MQPANYAFAMVGGYALPFGKGQREFLQAAARIHQQLPQARYLIVGPGNLADVLKANTQRLGLEGKAWLTPYCNSMLAAMNALECLVHSQIGTEAMPGGVCDPQACGRPVIGSDLDGIPEALAMAGAGRLVKPGSLDELAEALREQAAAPRPDGGRRAAMHRASAAAFSIRLSADNDDAFFRELLAEGLERRPADRAPAAGERCTLAQYVPFTYAALRTGRKVRNRMQRTTYANDQEDLQVLKSFNGQPGIFVEAGANHPVNASQTYLLEQRGWRGVLIEPNPELVRLRREQRPNSQTFDCTLVEPGAPASVRMRVPNKLSALASIDTGKGVSSDHEDYFECPARTLDSVLTESGIERIDFFSIDLEGYEPPALRGFGWSRWRPRLMTIEDHCENLRTHRALTANAYRLIRRIGDNHWYVPREAPHTMTPRQWLRFMRKMYLSLPFRKLRHCARPLRGKSDA